MIFICTQIYREKEIHKENSLTNVWGEIVRVVEANTEEEAIGKFILQTRSVNAIEKLGVTCYDLQRLKRL